MSVHSFLVCSLSTVLFLFLAAVSEVLFLPGCYAEYLLLIYIFLISCTWLINDAADDDANDDDDEELARKSVYVVLPGSAIFKL